MSFLPGMAGVAGAVGAAAVTSLALEDSALSTGATITGPASIQAGDLLILKDRPSQTGSVPSTAVPSGFSIISNIDNGTTTRVILSYKIADGSEASATLTGMSSANTSRKELLVFRANSPITAVNVQSVNGEFTTGDPSPQTVTASGGELPLVVIGSYATASAIPDPRGMSPDKDGEINSGNQSYTAWKIYNESPADVTVDMDDEGTTNILQSCYIECS